MNHEYSNSTMRTLTNTVEPVDIVDLDCTHKNN